MQAELIPDVRSIEETLEKVAVPLTDDAVTDLSRKGTGVRGGVPVAMLRYLAEQSRRALVLAIEEPEAFLHPAAQENLRDDLEALAVRDDVTAIITMHSPSIVSRSDNARLFAIEKDTEGRTRIKDSANGAESHPRLLGGLFRDRAVALVLDRATAVPSHAADPAGRGHHRRGVPTIGNQGRQTSPTPHRPAHRAHQQRQGTGPRSDRYPRTDRPAATGPA